MKNLLAVMLVLMTPAAAWACDDDAPKLTLVGLLSKDRVLVREASGSEQRIELFVLDLAKGVTTEYATILAGDEPDAERDRIRGQGWKKVQADLAKQGLVLKTLEEHPLPFTLGEVVLSAACGGRGDDSGCVECDFRATKGKVSRTLDTTGYCGSSDTTNFSAVVVTPDGRHIIPIISSGCAERPTKWVKAFTVTKLLSKKSK